MEKKLQVKTDKKHVAAYLKDKWHKQLLREIGKKGYFTTVLSGGNTPLDLYKEIALIKDISWDKVYFFLADERYVPRESENSNYSHIKQVLFDHLPIPGENIYSFNTELTDETICAADYEEKVLAFFRSKNILFPIFDFILLGLGDDGHTASIFPGETRLLSTGRTALATDREHQGTKRLSLSLEMINRGIQIYFMVCGPSKAPIVSRLFNEYNMLLPASRVETVRGEVVFVMDKEAASSLPPDLHN